MSTLPTVAEDRIFAGRLLRLGLTDENGVALGRVDDILIAPAYSTAPPHVLGFVAEVQRRRIFVNTGRIGEVDSRGVRLRHGTVDLRHFRARPGELLVSKILGRRVGGETVMDVALRRSDLGEWDVAEVALGGGRAIYRRTRRVVDWHEVRSIFEGGVLAAQVAALRDLNPTDVAAEIHALAPDRRAMLAAAIPEEQLADVLEELPEEEQVRLLEDMDLSRVADVIEEMEPDDAADLLAAMPPARRADLLDAIEPEDATSLRRLLRYDASTAGGLMTPEPVIVGPDVAVAEVLAIIRRQEIRAAVAAQVFVCEPPFATPTGRYLGVVGFQRLLRESPSQTVGNCVRDAGYVEADLPQRQVAERLAAYNLIGLAVCDKAGRLIGAVTVDDVLDQTLPVGWRRSR